MTSPSPDRKGLSPDAADKDGIRESVRQGYARIAVSGTCGRSDGGPAGEEARPRRAAGGCCGGNDLDLSHSLAAAMGYAPEELDRLPEGANLGLSCGNPTAIAALAAGEVVLDLGSGGGFDCFIAGPRVGATGRVIGVDMTAEMIARARRNLLEYRRRSGLDNVEFRLGEIENLPVADRKVDVVISNCVLNLSPDKPRVWREIARVLRPGGRVAVSDIALLRPLPAAVAADLEALVGCVAGAVLVEELRCMIAAAGFEAIELTPREGYVEAMTASDDPLFRRLLGALPSGSRAADFVTSVSISARKP